MSLYLIRTFGRSAKKTALKVGYTSDLKNRIDSYKYHNPFSELISTREGSNLDEVRVHTYLNSLGYKLDVLNEWFKDVDDVIQLFHKPFETMNGVIWKNRDNLFTINDFKSENIMNKLYEELKLIQNPVEGWKDIFHLPKLKIDKDWSFIQFNRCVRNFKLTDDIDL